MSKPELRHEHILISDRLRYSEQAIRTTRQTAFAIRFRTHEEAMAFVEDEHDAYLYLVNVLCDEGDEEYGVWYPIGDIYPNSFSLASIMLRHSPLIVRPRGGVRDPKQVCQYGGTAASKCQVKGGEGHE